jgi:hypothetical protein
MGIGDVVTNLTQLIRSVASISQSISKSFPQVTGTATTATGGAATLPANPVGFIVITLPSGSTAKVPYYNS